MGSDWGEWAKLALHWLHLVAGIAWIGSSFYFMWLDSHLRPPATPKEGVAGELWSVHSGGFYQQHKFNVAPAEMPDQLHWFKWEAYTTWISGFLLLSLIFYAGAETNLIDRAKVPFEPWQAILVGLAAVALALGIYEALCRSVLGTSLATFGLVWLIVLTWFAYALTQVFADLGAFMHMGAIIGTVMAANVFFIIIPNQKKMVAQVRAGETPDARLGKQSKQRSVHNNYMTLPVLFIMISNHYPMTYGAERPWLVLALLGLTGVAIRHVFNLRGRGQKTGWAIALALVLAAASVTYVTLEKGSIATGPAENITYAQIAPLLATHCAGCHNVPTPPRGVALDSYDHVRAAAPRVKAMAVDSQAMPLGNPTHMTPAERQRLGAWIDAGAPR